MEKSSESNQSNDLRHRAEAFLDKRSDNINDFALGDIKHLIEELRVHQIELEMQNEELHKAQLESEEAKDKYSDLYDFAPVGYFTMNHKGMITEANLTGASMLGIERGSLPGKFFSNFVSKDNQEILHFHRKKLIETKEKQVCELKLVNKDGSDFYARLECIVLSKDSGISIQAAVSDIADIKLAENKVLKAKEEWEKTFNAIDECVTIHDKNMRLVNMNRATAQLFDTDREKLLGKTCYELFRNGSQPCEGCPVWESRLDKTTHSNIIEHPNLGKTLQVSAYPIFDDKGQLTGLVHTAKDITQQQQIEVQLQQAQKLESIGTLAGGIAHDFNNMLSVITGNVSYLLNHHKDDEELVEVLSDIQEGANASQKLTQQLLTFSKGGSPVKEVVDINHAIKESAKFVTRGSKVKCNFELSDNLWIAEVDPGQINQVISNLVINANQSMPRGGIINIRSENIEIGTGINISLPKGKYIKIIIEDQGIGISKNHLQNIFDPYFTTKQAGSGLGLATSYSIIKKHGGQILVESKLDEGTTFIIYLPASEKKITKIEEKQYPEHKGTGRVLVMDDEETVLKVSKRILASKGYEVVLAKDGKEVIEKYEQAFLTKNSFKLVILDLTIPGGMGGAETIPEILRIDPQAKVIVSSGYSDDPVMANYKDYGLAGILPKPFRIAQMAKLLNNILGEKA